MASTNPKAVHSLILDANPILRNDPPVSTLLAQAEQLYSIPAVIDEIRDATARARVETTLLPFLTLRTPKPASIKIITDFARRTGDLEVLSKPDVQILALAYELECERNHGDWRLRSMPGQKRTNGPPPASLTGLSTPAPTNTSTETSTEAPEVTKTRTQSGLEEMFLKPKGIDPSEIAPAGDAVVDTEATPDSHKDDQIPESPDSESVAKVAADVAPESISEIEQAMAVTAVESIGSEEEQAAVDEQEEDDDEGWITPSNLQKHKDADNDASAEPQPEPKIMQVATITADFAMQNVLLRMNLNLLSPSLQRIKQLKTWVLRCHACFDISKDMTRQFCKKCGKPTLLRTSCSTDKDGNFQVHLKKNMQWNNRGNVYSIPKPVAGSSNGKRSEGGGKGGWGLNLILAEDQKEYVQAVTTEKRRKEKDLMDEDYLPNILSGDRRGQQGRPKVGAGKNVNARKRH